MDLQDRENTTLPVLETELREVENGIQNILNAIQMGILTRSTKSRLEELESSKEDLEIKIANEKIAKPRISGEFITFWLHKFRKLDINRQDHRKWLINVFVNAIYLYDDKMVMLPLWRKCGKPPQMCTAWAGTSVTAVISVICWTRMRSLSIWT